MKNNPCIGIILDPWELGTFLPKDLRQQLEQVSTDLHFVEPASLLEDETWASWLEEHQPEILISAWMTPRLPEDVLERVPSLKYVCHLVGAVKGTVPDELIEKGLLVTNWGSSIARTVAECGLMMAIAGLRRVSHWSIELHQRGGWKDRMTVQTGSLFGRKVGLHGFGAIAQELAKLLQPFEVQLMTYSPSVPDSLLEAAGVARADDLETLFSSNDVLIELAALTPKNRGIVTEELLRSIPEGGVFVNIGRGAVVDEEALVRVAAEGRIQVALDVYKEEPLPRDSPLRGMTNVLLLPHLGGPTIDRRRDATALGLKNVRHYLRGEPLESQVTSRVYQRIT